MFETNVNVLANRIRLLRQVDPDKAILIVEGKSDLSIYRLMVSSNHCQVFWAEGRDHVQEVVRLLIELSGVLGIIDADFLRIEADHRAFPSNILLTDFHDLESMIMHSPALERLLGHFGSDEKIKNLSEPPRSLLLKAAKYIACFRLYARNQTDYCFTFRPKLDEPEVPNYSKFIDETTLDVNLDEMIRIFKNYSKISEINENMIKVEIEKYLTENFDLWQLCNGHDLGCVTS